ncbi:MAG: VIT1/CCC1 transporter family protein [Burkholderiales bacterium]|nr:VIT1/CCC1 transporter family protein [Burkholderiales bacterium]
MTPRANWTEAERLAHLYRACAAAEFGSVRGDLFARLAGESQAQAAIWRARLTARGEPPPPPYLPDARTRLVERLIRWLGPRRLRSVLSAMSLRGVAVYATSYGAEAGRAEAGSTAIRQHAHRSGGGDLRGVIFGVNEGLVSNVCLMLGVAGASGDARTVFVCGVAGLAGGALAVASGEYVALRSQRERVERQVVSGLDAPKRLPAAAARELALNVAARGMQPKQSSARIRRDVEDSEQILDGQAHEAAGPGRYESASPLAGATALLLAFAVGAALPLMPFLLVHDMRALPVSIAVAATALFGTGAALSLFTGHSAWFSGARMLALGTLAGGITFVIGRLAGVAFG